MSQVTIELGRTDKNMDVAIPLLGENRLGRWSKANLGLESLNDPIMMQTPNIPGWRVSIDVRQKKVKVFHPWHNTDDGRRAEKQFREKRGQKLSVDPPTILDELDELAVQDWLKWAYRITNDKAEHCAGIVVDGEFPKGVKEACAAERDHDRRIANAYRDMAEERALASAKAAAVADSK